VNTVASAATRTATNGSLFEAPGIVAFPISDAAGRITGRTINASGGLFLGPHVRPWITLAREGSTTRSAC
jgi:3-oxoacyl-[acyl-carrier protein] reductase